MVQHQGAGGEVDQSRGAECVAEDQLRGDERRAVSLIAEQDAHVAFLGHVGITQPVAVPHDEIDVADLDTGRASDLWPVGSTVNGFLPSLQ